MTFGRPDHAVPEDVGELDAMLACPSASWSTLQARHRLLRRLRAFFDGRGFLEVTTPLLSRETVVDPHIEPLRVTRFEDPTRPAIGPTWYLQTSPEFHMKRLLAAGASAIYQVTQSFRAAEHGSRHNPEFTIAEWYRAGDGLAAGMSLLSDLISDLLSVPPARLTSYRDIFLQEIQIDPLECQDEELRACALALGAPPTCLDRDDCLNWLLATQIEPKLGWTQPDIVFGFPATQAALARISADDPRTADRFELFFRGIELANGYFELIDAAEWSTREEAANGRRATAGRPLLPSARLFTQAMRRGLPDCTGVALGFDRLVMAALELPELARVLTFPADRA